MDMQQKLLPIFLKEADINLELLRQFLQNRQLSVSRLADVEAAFRAAHTLKGTSRLVRAEAINSISRRLEGMLEKHLSAKTGPTMVEFEAMQLAVEWLSQLVTALREQQPEPKSLVTEALLALDLAGHFPGTTPLIELLDSNAEQRSPLLDDPFADDPEPQVDETEILQATQDPFAEDPDFGLGLANNLQSDAAIAQAGVSTAIEDPFADDARFDSDSFLAGEGEAESDALPDTLPFDLFADDQSYLEAVDNSVSNGVAGENDIASGTSDEFATENHLGSELEPVVDPFAEDPTVEMESEASVADAAARPESEVQQLDRARNVVESLLLPQTDERPRRNYICCAFEFCARSYYLPIRYMVEIAEQPPLLPLPLAPAVVKGLINLRGQVMPVIDLSVLHPGQMASDQVQRLVIAELKGEKLAFLAEGVPYLSEEHVGEEIDLPEFVSHHRIRGAGV